MQQLQPPGRRDQKREIRNRVKPRTACRDLTETAR
jgi:hypothetical protein